MKNRRCHGGGNAAAGERLQMAASTTYTSEEMKSARARASKLDFRMVNEM